MPDEPEEIAVAGRKIVEMLGACAAAPDDVAIGQAADDALRKLEQLLAAAEQAAQTA
jgi:hypothetical protein